MRKENNMSIVAVNTKKIIKQRGLLQKKVAIDAGYTPKRFSDLLNNRKIVTDQDIIRIANVLRVSPNELFKSE
ncbi:MAG: XRE family transcriptional regulator [Dielma fastidiosa]|nr:helix-turn-helix transcriptional regulator [Bacillota bacterium]PWM54008.1 MAG: XRE family transcriptional regulator [Dielma fastidiosa]